MRSQQQQAGFTILETLIALAIGVLVVASAGWGIGSALSAYQSKELATGMERIGVVAYDYYDLLGGSVTAWGALTNKTVCDDLPSAGIGAWECNPAGTSLTDPLGNAWSISGVRAGGSSFMRFTASLTGKACQSLLKGLAGFKAGISRIEVGATPVYDPSMAINGVGVYLSRCNQTRTVAVEFPVGV